ncbi:potassium channel [Aureococcus anophagefferens]|nr:potassium channel [Aureococcus anophagefferens]
MAPPVAGKRRSSVKKGGMDKIVHQVSGGHRMVVDEHGKMHGWEWTLKESCYFLTVTYTTVGYGDITPRTDGGKAFAMFYALVGVAVVFPVVLELGQWLVDYLERNILERFNRSRTEKEAKSIVEPVWPKVSLSVFLVLIPLFVGAAFFSHTHVRSCGKAWTEWDAFWWSFATITTIGYGDLDLGCEGDVQVFLTVYIVLSVTEERLLNDFDVDRILAMDMDGDGVQKAEFVIGMLVAMDALDQDKLALYSNKFDELDADGSGSLDADDLLLLVDQMKRRGNDRASSGGHGPGGPGPDEAKSADDEDRRRNGGSSSCPTRPHSPSATRA